MVAMIKKGSTFLKFLSFFSMLPLFKINNHRAAYGDMDNNLYNIDKDTADNLLGTEKNKNMDNNLGNTDKGVVDIPHCTNIAESQMLIFSFVCLLSTKPLNQGMHLNV